MQVASLPAITSSPRGFVSSSAMTSCARRRRSNICSAYSAKILPAVVSEIRLPKRSNRSEIPTRVCLQFGDDVLCAAPQIQHLLGILGENLARRGERNPAAETFEQVRDPHEGLSPVRR